MEISGGREGGVTTIGPDICPTQFHGVSFINSAYKASLTVGDSCHEIGHFECDIDAAKAYDMEALRAFGLNALNLNFKYDIVERHPDNLIIKTTSGLLVSVDIVKSIAEYKLYAPMSMNKKIKSGIFTTNQSIITDNGPPMQDIHRPWTDRLMTCFQPTASFAYEITFPHQNSLGLNLTPFYVSNSVEGPGNGLGCLLVIDSTPFLSTIVHPGDILLKVNDCELVTGSDTFSFKEATIQVTKATAPRTLRFMRPGNRYNKFSPVELKLLSQDSYQPIARSHVVPGDPPAQGMGQTYKLQLAHLDPQAPSAIRRAVNGKKVVWEVVQSLPPGSSASMSLPPTGSSGGSSGGGSGAMQSQTFVPPSTKGTGSGSASSKEGLCRDRNKWTVTVSAGKPTSVGVSGSGTMSGKSSGQSKRIFFVGRFDTEEEALTAQKKAQEELNLKGILTSCGYQASQAIKTKAIARSTSALLSTLSTSTNNSGN
eukprot:gene5322-10646_t